MTPVKEYLDSLNRPETQRAYYAGIKRFLAYVYKKEITPNNLEEYGERYLQELEEQKRDSKRDILSFTSSSGKAPSTRTGRIQGVVSWLGFYDVELSSRARRDITRKAGGRKVQTIDRIPTKEELKKILEVSPPQLRALIYFLTSTGCRIGEAVQLLPKHIRFDADPVMVTVPGTVTKTGSPRRTYLTREAAPVLQDWIQYREKYLQVMRANTGKRNPENPRLFPFTSRTATKMLNNALERCGLTRRDPTTDRYEIHVHSFRKYFKTNLMRSGNGNAEFVSEALMGHEGGYLANSYMRVTPEEIQEFFKNAEQSLWINTPISVKDPEAEKRLEEQEKRIVELEAENAKNRELINLITSMIKKHPEVLTA